MVKKKDGLCQSDCLVLASHYHPLNVTKNYLEDSLGGRSLDVTCSSSQCGHIHYIFFFCFSLLKNTVSYPFPKRQESRENYFCRGQSCWANPEKFRAYFLGWCHCGSAKERGASLTGLEMKETKNIQPSYVWETMPALNNLKCRLRTEGHLYCEN